MTIHKLRVLCGSALLGGMAALSSPVMAANDAMIELIEVMRANGNINEAQYEALIAAAREDSNEQEELKKEMSEAADSLPVVSVDEGLEFESRDGNWKWEIGGRIMQDFAFYDNDDAPLGSSVADMNNGAELRRARIALEGQLYKVWNFKLQYDFADTEIKDAWLSYNGFNKTGIKVGQFKEPFGLEELTSSKYDTFMHESQVTQAFAPSRTMGGGVYIVPNDMFTLAAGLFSENIDDDAGRDNPAGSGWGTTGRVTFSPVHEDGRVVHFGVAGSYRTPDQADGFGGVSASLDTHISEPDIIDTGSIGNVDDFTKLGLEAAAVWKRFSLQGEYMRQDLNRSMGGDLDFDGYYIQGSFFLTDDFRPYDFGDGEFDKVDPKSPFSLDGGTGAWEVAARYGSLDLSDASAANGFATNEGGEIDNISLGLNWYATKLLRFTVNYNQVLDNGAPTASANAGLEPSSIEARAQVFW